MLLLAGHKPVQTIRSTLWRRVVMQNVTRVGVCLLTALLAAGAIWQRSSTASAQNPLTRFAGPTSSQPLALNADGTLLAVANPDNDSITLFDVAQDRNRRLAEVRVGIEPNGVALNPAGTRAYV